MFSIDSSNLEEIKKARELGVEMVTTNPTSLEGKDVDQTIINIARMGFKYVNVEPAIDTRTKPVEFEKEAKRLFNLSQRKIVIKIPCTESGYKIGYNLKRELIPINMTLCFDVYQAITAMSINADFISPFLGRLEEKKFDYVNILNQMLSVINDKKSNTKIIAASIRNKTHVLDSALCGCHFITMPYKVLLSLMENQQSLDGIDKFLKSYK